MTGDKRDLRRNALEDGPHRDRLYNLHPVVMNRVILPTPPVKATCNIVLQVVTHRDPGTMFVGAFRSGKSVAIIAIQAELKRCLPQHAVFSLIAKTHDKPSETNFYADLIGDLRQGAAAGGKINERRHVIINVLKTEAQLKRGDCVVLLVDEAQCWGERELTMLRDIGNDVEKLGISLVTILFGDHNLVALRHAMVKRGRQDLFGRFLMTQYSFPGISSQGELFETLSLYNDPEVAEYPAKSGITYSEFFSPGEYRTGWRLDSEADLAWAAFKSIAARSSRSPTNIGMAWISNAIRNYLFSQLAPDPDDFPRSKSELWLECVENSGYELSLAATM